MTILPDKSFQRTVCVAGGMHFHYDKEGLKGRETIHARVERLEQEMKKVKRRLAA